MSDHDPQALISRVDPISKVDPIGDLGRVDLISKVDLIGGSRRVDLGNKVILFARLDLDQILGRPGLDTLHVYTRWGPGSTLQQVLLWCPDPLCPIPLSDLPC